MISILSNRNLRNGYIRPSSSGWSVGEIDLCAPLPFWRVNIGEFCCLCGGVRLFFIR